MPRIGILGGGQLGRMTIEEARKLLCYIEVLSPEYPAPAAVLADETVLGPLMDADAVRELAERVDVLSYEIEHVNATALRQLEREGKLVIPPAEVLELIQDKQRQKEVLGAAGVPMAAWCPVDDGDVAAAAEALGGFPVVQKSRYGGYDGRGVAVLDSSAQARPVAAGGKLLADASFLERKIPFTKELAVMVAIDRDGNSASWPCVEMFFDERVNMCDSVLMPARESPELRLRAEAVARTAVQAILAAAERVAAAENRRLTLAGVFAVELFLTSGGDILVNELAPRPHNSGHVTIEACVTSQFNQYYRILAGYPLGSTEQVLPAMMVNLLGEPDADGEVEYSGLGEALAIPGVTVHLYGKQQVKPFRKMGHLTALGRTLDEAMDRAERARNVLKVRSAPVGLKPARDRAG